MFSSSFKPIALKLDPGKIVGTESASNAREAVPMTSCSYDFNGFMTDFQGVLQRNRLSQQLLGEVGSRKLRHRLRVLLPRFKMRPHQFLMRPRQFPKRPQEFIATQTLFRPVAAEVSADH
jgi:hypothetical protein